MRLGMHCDTLVRLDVALALLIACATQSAPAQTAAASIATPSPIHWQPLYEPGCGGWITCFIASPHDPKHCLIGGDMLGIAFNDDRGDHWQPALGLPTWEICDFTWHPTDANIVWAGTFAGPCKSSDGGRTWTLKRTGFPPVNAGRYNEESPPCRHFAMPGCVGL
jgi:hypothetical protein